MKEHSYHLTPIATGSAINYKKVLNEQQYAAVTSEPGTALVIAGAGSGKTRTLTYRVSWLIERGFLAEQILLLTFTNKAAREMLTRVDQLLPGRTHGLWGGTFHSIGHRILRRHAEEIGFEKNFTILDRDDQKELLEAWITRQGLRAAENRFPKGNVLAEIISLCNNTGLTLEAVVTKRYRYFFDLQKELKAAMVAYEAAKQKANALDFDDLLLKTYELFVTHPEIAARYQQQFRAILVDEYQDTNRIQANLIDLLAARHKHIMAVGDDAQSIYSWRGADVSNMLAFSKRHPGTQFFSIETNYRSVPQVLALANASIRCNTTQFSKELQAIRPAHTLSPVLLPLATSNEQASFIAQRISELHQKGMPLRDIAVLYRSHYHSMEIQLELTRRHIPFVITSGLRFFEQAHIKDVAAVMKFALNPNDEVALKRLLLLFPGIGKKTAEGLWNQIIKALEGTRDFSRLTQCKPPKKATKEWNQLVATLLEISSHDPSDAPQLAAPTVMIEAILFAFYDEILQEKFTNYEARREDLATLSNYAKQFSDTAEFLAQLALLGEGEEQQPANVEHEDQLCLSSIHQAKGLEWPVVFLTWLTEGMFPTRRSFDDKAAMEEERRLFYVAVTRCKEELYLTYPEFSSHANYGEAFQRPSRFLAELDPKFYERWNIAMR
ncbi:MAG: ATP-dependent helicase [Chthoniobacterales bacterium]|nr:ATP-dependent helicase [Chthoniobacterales bacterium]